jgi:hypothetical protein
MPHDRLRRVATHEDRDSRIACADLQRCLGRLAEASDVVRATGDADGTERGAETLCQSSCGGNCGEGAGGAVHGHEDAVELDTGHGWF